MKNTTKALLVALGIAIPTFIYAQDQQGRPERPQGNRPPPQQREGGRPPEGGRGQEGQRPPLFAALDANGDGTIDATEIASASENLRKLDKNGDGKITPDEIGPRPRGQRPQGDGAPDRQGRPERPARGDRGNRGPADQ